ncbi:MAG: class I SAM-dependent methyltransferase [Undibacterium sp.]|nr:class I SAM-dependent methyltransferase [Undibacterium sp.]
MSEARDTIIDLGAWLAQPAGAYIRAWEQSQFDLLAADIFGYHAVQVGLPQINALSTNRMPHRWRTDSKWSAVDLVHDFTELPFDSQSIDLVVLPHILELAKEPHQVLREVERVLIPEGRLIVSGLNRASLWGARQTFGRAMGSHFLPEEGEFISPSRLKDWLKLMNMEVAQTRFGCYAFPVNSEAWLTTSSMMENLGKRWWPYFGAVYMFEAVKRVRGMHLVGPVLKRKRMRRGSVIALANKSKN